MKTVEVKTETKVEKKYFLGIGPTCSLCYWIWSAVMILTMVIIGILEYPAQYEKINGEEEYPIHTDPETLKQYQKTALITAGLYAICLVGCFLRWCCLYYKNKNEANAYVQV